MPTGEYVRPHEARKLAHSRNGFRFNVQEFLIDFVPKDAKASAPSPLGRLHSRLRNPQPVDSPGPKIRNLTPRAISRRRFSRNSPRASPGVVCIIAGRWRTGSRRP